jgi:hypothetical protein
LLTIQGQDVDVVDIVELALTKLPSSQMSVSLGLDTGNARGTLLEIRSEDVSSLWPIDGGWRTQAHKDLE